MTRSSRGQGELKIALLGDFRTEIDFQRRETGHALGRCVRGVDFFSFGRCGHAMRQGIIHAIDGLKHLRLGIHPRDQILREGDADCLQFGDCPET
jgi:hypothetical protein